MIWTLHRPMHLDRLGLLPQMLHESDPRPARDQLNEGYAHGGGWRPMDGWLHIDEFAVQYPDDPPYLPIATTSLRNEVIAVYDHAWVAIFQPDGTFEICRMD